jgi:hypothetical protein
MLRLGITPEGHLGSNPDTIVAAKLAFNPRSRKMFTQRRKRGIASI